MNIQQLLKIVTLVIATLGRVIPHPWNMTPTISLSLFVGKWYRSLSAILLTVLAFFISDVVLAYLQHHSIFGVWSWFSYSGIIMVTLLAQRCRSEKFQANAMLLLSASGGYWLWTNFGCWLTMPEYSNNVIGLLHCYTAALPFLKNQLLGDCLWYGVLSWALSHYQRQQSHTQSSTT